ncbi:hypothetical protein ACIBG4_40630 [Nonomuraea sp. NPDC050383]|uniref:hypothetical protein n=1 Tax=Nonomuraea sp. NPDC050383 TaxID=3364362 RepID=UPI0037B84008
MNPEPVTAVTAARRLKRQPVTIRQWARRYQAAQLGKDGRQVFYDFRDLATIDACIYRGEPVPETPQARAELRDRYRAAA